MSDESQTEDVLSLSVRDFTAATAAKTATPGGGSVAAVVGALGVALGEMALNFTRGKSKYAEHEQLHAGLAGRLGNARRMFEALVADDIAAYQLYQAATRRGDGADKDQAVQLATAAAIDVPRQAAKVALAVLKDLRALSGACNPWLITDLLGAAVLATAAARLCDYNVRVNVPNVADKPAGQEILQASRADLQRAETLLAEIEQAAAAHLA